MEWGLGDNRTVPGFPSPVENVLAFSLPSLPRLPLKKVKGNQLHVTRRGNVETNALVLNDTLLLYTHIIKLMTFIQRRNPNIYV